MADKKISELTAVVSLVGTELMEVVQGGVNKKTTTQDIADLSSGAALTNGSGTTANGTAVDLGGTLTGPVNINADNFDIRVSGTGTDEARVVVDAANNIRKAFVFRTGNVERWQIHCENNETGVSNVGSDLHFERYNDAGVYIDTPMGIGRTDGLVFFEEVPFVAPSAPVTTTGTNTNVIATTAFVQQEIGGKVDEETFATLTFASPTNWDQNNRQSPLAKVTATGNFTINMTNVKSGAQGILIITASTASAFTLTFDTDFTNRDIVTGATLTTYTFPANNGFVYTNSFIVDGTTIYWCIGDYFNPAITNPTAEVTRAASQVIPNNDSTNSLSWDTEVYDNASIFTSGSPTILTIPGSGNKTATITVSVSFDVNTTGVRRVLFYLNGALVSFKLLQAAPTAVVATNITGTVQINCAAGDTIEVRPYQNSGGNLNATAGAVIKIESR